MADDFRVMLAELQQLAGQSQVEMATAIGVSPQFYHDIMHGRRLPSVAFVDKLCVAFGRGPKGRAEWHRAAAREHGWEIDDPEPVRRVGSRRSPFIRRVS